MTTAQRKFYQKKRFWILLLIFVFLFDWVPFYLTVRFLGWKDGGLKHHQIDASAEGYIQDRNLFGCSYESCWTPLLYTSPNRPRLKYVEFEVKNFSPNATDKENKRWADASGIPAEGNGWYRVQLEKRAIGECPLLQKKSKELSRYGMREGNAAYEKEVKLLKIFGERQICPYVRKVDAPKSRYMEGGANSTMWYWDGVHMIFRVDSRFGVDRLTGRALHEYISYLGAGTWLQPCQNRDTSGACGDLSPSFSGPKYVKTLLRKDSIFDLLGFTDADFSMNIDTLTLGEK